MIKKDIIRNKKYFDEFCASMTKWTNCRFCHCQQTSCASALRYVQKRVNEGLTIDAAVQEWTESGLSHKDGKEILADLLGVDNLDKVRELLREEKDGKKFNDKQ